LRAAVAGVEVYAGVPGAGVLPGLADEGLDGLGDLGVALAVLAVGGGAVRQICGGAAAFHPRITLKDKRGNKNSAIR
jgi:hypothetical protein